jgi:6-pyruvoyltetrahydropterin/6-carboxytetrahydropterin synthase|tara:strand:- start:238 stop:702 length:465 start_codon:yes stop_codon:yes gene_type:complete
MGKFQSSKVFDGFSTVFRQWKAETTHCRFVHGYGISFKVYFEGDLDERNWVWDFGGMKRAKTQIDGKSPKEWMDYMFDHTLIVAEDDPFIKAFQQMDDSGVAQVRVIPATGAEKFAEYIYNKLNEFVNTETEGRVRVTKVKFMEHGKNAACYVE